MKNLRSEKINLRSSLLVAVLVEYRACHDGTRKTHICRVCICTTMYSINPIKMNIILNTVRVKRDRSTSFRVAFFYNRDESLFTSWGGQKDLLTQHKHTATK